MNTPRIASMAALAASLIIVVMTITQANGSPNGRVFPAGGTCVEAEAASMIDCPVLTSTADVVR